MYFCEVYFVVAYFILSAWMSALVSVFLCTEGLQMIIFATIDVYVKNDITLFNHAIQCFLLNYSLIHKALHATG